MAENNVTNIWDIKFPYAMVPADWIPTKRAFREVNVALSELARWDFQHLLAGRVPTADYNGAKSSFAFSGETLSLRGSYVGIRADWKARRDLHHCVRHYGCNRICDRCWACKPHVDAAFSYHDVTCEFDEDPETRSPWLRIAGAHLDLHLFDLMHVLFIGRV